MELTSLLPLLRAHGVLKFKNADIEIHFESGKLAEPAPKAPEPEPVSEPVPPNMPAELVHPELMSVDMIRDWSASPDYEPVAPLDGTEDIKLAVA